MQLDDIERLARKIQAKLFKNSNSTIQGIYKSRFKGSGITFKEHKVYSHGDDVRFIDWKVSTRQDKMYVKTFEEERNVKISIFIDLSNSMTLGWRSKSKIEVSLEICYLFFLLSEKTKDLINLNFILDKVYETSFSSGKQGLTNSIMFMSKKGILLDNGKPNLDLKRENFITPEQVKKKLQYNLQSKKEVLLISDLRETIKIENIKDLLTRSNFHCVKLEAPIDSYESESVMIHGLSNDGTGFRKNISELCAGGKKEKVVNKKLKVLELKNESYLEDFVKTMV